MSQIIGFLFEYAVPLVVAQELSELATKELGLVALSTALGMRVAYMEALGDGLTVAELSEPSAKVEARFLTEEVQKLLRKTS